MKHEKFRHIKLRVIKVFGRSFFAINETLKRQKANFEYFANHRVYLDEATMPDNTEVDKDKVVKQMKRSMECWREVVIPAYSILLWEKPWHPGLLVGLTTSIALLIYTLEPAFLTLFAVCMLLAALADYLVPIIISTFVSPSSWNGHKEKTLNEVAMKIFIVCDAMLKAERVLARARINRPNLYYVSVTISLLLLAWMGNSINNLFLMWLSTTILLLIPGCVHKARFHGALKSAYEYLTHRKSS